MDFDYIGSFIRSFRHANKESLQSLADRSGVSRSMIAQIESSQKSPTLVVLAKLAEAMNISISDLVKPPDSLQDIQVLAPTDDNVITRKNSSFVCHQLVTQSASSPADLYRFYFIKNGKTSFAANRKNTVKYIWIERGQLIVYISTKKIVLNTDQALKFNASTPHRFENRQGELVSGTFFVAYHS